MSDDAWGFAPPPFKVDDAAQGLRRQLRELGLSERQGIWERRGVAIAKAAPGDGVIHAAQVQRPSRSSPQWQHRQLKSSADVRDFVATLKKLLALWSDNDD